MRFIRITAAATVLCVSFVAALSAATPAERRIGALETALEAGPPRATVLNDLAMAYARRARETADPAFYARAEETVEKSLALEPDNYGARRVRAWTLLGRHEFAQALEAARALNKRAPDDVMVYGMLADAYVELGRYDEAIESLQWMLDMRPGAPAGLTRAAYIRELYGYEEGALEFFRMAAERMPRTETEDRAWILAQVSHLHVAAGRHDLAQQSVDQALALFPDYHYALAELGRLRLAQQRYGEAADAFRQRYDAAPHPENLYELAAALEAAGEDAEAESLFAEFGAAARAESASWDNANRELIDYYADRAGKPAEALRVAELEIGRRQDIFTRAAYAWAQHVNGRQGEAYEQIKLALATGLKDAKMLYRAGRIAAAAGDEAVARENLERSLKANPRSLFSDEARTLLAESSTR